MTNKISILDGGMGRHLEAIGAPFRRPEWSALALMEGPQYVEQAHDQFIDAGAQIITVNSYAIVPFHIGQERFKQDGRTLINLAAKIAQKSAQKSDNTIKVAGSLPPAFGSYRPDLFNTQKAAEIYKPLIEEQNDFVDLWILETMGSIIEAETICKLLGQTSKPIWISYTVKDRAGDESIEPQLRSGESIQQAEKAAKNLNASAILFNCSQIEEMTPALNILQSTNINIPYGVYANAFPPIQGAKMANADTTAIRKDVSPSQYLSYAQDWVNSGATIIGGCCGIGPAHIKELATLNA